VSHVRNQIGSSADFCNRSKTSVHHYDGSNVDLGTAAGKLYRVGVMSIQDAGDSDLVSLVLTTSSTIADEIAASSRGFIGRCIVSINLLTSQPFSARVMRITRTSTPRFSAESLKVGSSGFIGLRSITATDKL